MTSAFENLCGPGKPLKAEPPDAKEFSGLLRSGAARLKDAGSPLAYSDRPSTIKPLAFRLDGR